MCDDGVCVCVCSDSARPDPLGYDGKGGETTAGVGRGGEGEMPIGWEMR